MTCCEEDITFMAIPCQWQRREELKPRSWVTVTAKIAVKKHAIYRGIGPILVAKTVEPAEPAQPDVATF